jgi:anaerobic selenocysteine-containing dehydrogenase
VSHELSSNILRNVGRGGRRQAEDRQRQPGQSGQSGEGETRPIYEILGSLANSLGFADFFPWASLEEVLDAILVHPTAGHATVASLRAAGGFLPLKAPHVACADRNFNSPSGKIEFYSSQAAKLGLPPLHKVDKGSSYPLALSFGRTLTHFHAFYDEGRALPSLARHNAAPQLWISRIDAEARQLSSGDAIKICNERGEFWAKAHVTEDAPPGAVWIRDGWVYLNHLTSGDAVLTGDALGLFPFLGWSVRLSHQNRGRSDLNRCLLLGSIPAL